MVALLAVALTASLQSHALPDPESVEIDGVLYGAFFPSTPPYYKGVCYAFSGYDYPVDYFELSNIVEECRAARAEECGVDRAAGARQLKFNDGTVIPAFMDAAHIDSIVPGTKELWIQDSVPLQSLVRLREKVPYYISRLTIHPRSPKSFPDDLRFIRTPRYAKIPSYQFKDFKQLKSVRIGAAGKVESSAFQNCESLETVFFETAPTVESAAFSNCLNIKTIVLAGKLPLCESYAISTKYFNDYSGITLYVRPELIEACKQDPFWKHFLDVRDINEYYAGVEGVIAEAAEQLLVYNLSGTLVRTAMGHAEWREGLPSGVYIVKSSRGSARKEYVR